MHVWLQVLGGDTSMYDGYSANEARVFPGSCPGSYMGEAENKARQRVDY